MFSVKRILKNIRFNIKKYIFLMIEFFLGSVILAAGISVNISMNDRLSDLEKQKHDGVLEIKMYDDVPSYEDYEKVKEIYPETMFFGLDQSGENFSGFVPEIYLSPELFEMYFGFEMDEDAAYAGKNISDCVSLNGTRIENLGETEIKSFSVYDFGGSVKTDDSVFISDKYFIQNSPYAMIKFVITAKDDFAAEEIGSKVTELMKNIAPQIACQLEDPYITVKSGINDLTGVINTFTFISFVSMLIICVGSAGILLILLHSRLPGIYISLMLGATAARTRAEIFAEIFAVFFISGTAGVIAAIPLSGAFSNAYQNAAFHPVAALTVFGIICLISFISCVISLSGIDVKNPIRLLKRND